MDGFKLRLVPHKLLKTQKQMSDLLGVSLKAAQSFE